MSDKTTPPSALNQLLALFQKLGEHHAQGGPVVLHFDPAQGPQFNPNGAQPLTQNLASPRPVQDAALFQWLQAHGAGMTGEELRPSRQAEGDYMQGAYVPAAGAQVNDFESPMATDAEWAPPQKKKK